MRKEKFRITDHNADTGFYYTSLYLKIEYVKDSGGKIITGAACIVVGALHKFITRNTQKGVSERSQSIGLSQSANLVMTHIVEQNKNLFNMRPGESLERVAGHINTIIFVFTLTNMADLEKLIPDIKEWQKLNGDQFDAEDWIAIEGNIKLAIGYSLIFWPDFIQHENCVFLKSHFSIDAYNEWKKVDYVEYFAQIENVINHIHILDLFAQEEGKEPKISKDQIIYLGNVLREIYEMKLRAQFKDKTFVVTFNGQEDFSDLIDYELSFHQLINETKRIWNGG